MIFEFDDGEGCFAELSAELTTKASKISFDLGSDLVDARIVEEGDESGRKLRKRVDLGERNDNKTKRDKSQKTSLFKIVQAEAEAHLQ